MNEFIEYYFNSNPEIATMNGFKTYNGLYSAYTPEKDYKHYKVIYKKLLDKSVMTLEEKFLKIILENIIKEYKLGFHYTPFNHMENPIETFVELSSPDFTPLKTDSDWLLFIARLDYFGLHINNLIYYSKLGIKTGYLPIKLDLEKMINSINIIIENKVYSANKCGDVSDNLYNRYLDVCKNRVLLYIQIFKNYILDILKKQNYRTTIGMVDMFPDNPDRGKDIYKQFVLHETGFKTPIAELYNLGLLEVKKIKKEMLRTKSLLGYSEMSLEEFTNTKLKVPIRKENIIPEFKKWKTNNKEIVDKYFYEQNTKDSLIKPIPSHNEGNNIAYYWPPSIGKLREGAFYINDSVSANNSSHTFEVLSLHEDIPGHHYHFQYLNDNNISLFTRLFACNAYVEGWGLYCENLGEYSDKRSYFGKLSFEMLRACRLVVDTGIHYYGNSREWAINYLKKNCFLEMVEIEIEVDRYIAIPGQALSYKVGELFFLKAKKAYLDKYREDTIKDFHKKVLDIGPVPLELVSRVLH